MKRMSAAIFVMSIGLITIAPKCGDARKCTPEVAARECPDGECYEFKQEGGDWQQVCTPASSAPPPTLAPPPPSVPPPTLAPIPSPSITPPPSDDWRGNIPLTWDDIQNGVCPSSYSGEPVRVGVSFLSTRPCTGPCQREGYLGFIVNGSGTPRDVAPRCGHTCFTSDGRFATDNCRSTCEQLRGCQDGFSDPGDPTLGPVFGMRHAAWGSEWQRVDKRSDNNHNWHHKPRRGETGFTTFRACDRRWSFNDDPRCSEMVLNIKDNGVEDPNRRQLQAPRKPVRWEEGE